jgi:RND family efflux transporter MFP subunit
MLKKLGVNFLESFKRRKKRNIIITVALFAVVVTGGILASGNGKDENNGQVLGQTVAPVQTITIGDVTDSLNSIKTSGVVKADTKVNIVALNSGTVTGIYYEPGDIVDAGQVLASLNNEVAMSNFNSASTNYLNTQQNFNITLRLLDESVRQAELNLENAEERVNAAAITASNAKSYLENSKTIQAQTHQMTLQNGLSSYSSYLGSLENALFQVDYIIAVEGSVQLPGIAASISARDSQALYDATAEYVKAKDAYSLLRDDAITAENVVGNFPSLVQAMSYAQAAIEDTLRVIDATIPNDKLPEATLLAQKAAYQGLRQSFFAELSAAQATESNLKNLDAGLAIELDSLEAGLKGADINLVSANLSLEHAGAALSNAKDSRESQILSSGIALSAAEAQFRIAEKSLNNLSISAPISGEITFKSIELGSELMPGQKVAEVSQSNLVKVVVSLSSDDIYKISLGSTVKINDELEGLISAIDPAADPVTRKVKVEILFVNNDSELIPETFVDVIIPTAQAIEEGDANTESTIFVPLKSVIITPTEKFIYIYDNGFAKKALVITGDIEGDSVEIISGVNFGDEIITVGHQSLEDGDAIGKE